MQVNSISLNNSAKPMFRSNQDYLQTIANLDDSKLRQIAYNKTLVDVDEKKHRHVANSLYFSLPLAGALASAVRNPENSVKALKASYKGLSKINLGRYARLNSFVSTFVSLGSAILAIDATFGARKFLEKKIDAFKDFSKNHPVATTLGTIGASFVAISGANKLLAKGLNKFTSKVTSKQCKDFIAKQANFLNNNKVLNKISEKLAKVPSGIKNFASTVLDYSPILLVCSSIAHSISHEKAKVATYQQNYADLAEAQNLAREAMSFED